MNIKITGLSAAAAAEKKKKLTGAGAAGGPSFASFLDETTGATDVAGTSPTIAANTYAPIPASEDDDSRPQPGRKQATRLLDSLNDLAADTFSGSPTAALARLKNFLATTATDKDALTPQQRQALDEVETRAAVEVAKLGQ